MARLCKCHSCEDKFPKEELETISSKNYCLKCSAVIKKQKADREELTEVIKKLYNISFPTGLMLKQIKEYQEVRGYKLRGITLTLLYCERNLKMSFNQRYGIGIVPQYYESAKKYFIEQSKREKSNVDFKVIEQTMVIPKITISQEYKRDKIISLEDILCNN